LLTGKNFLATPLQKIYVLFVPCLHEAIVAAIGRGDDRRNRTSDRSSNPFADRRRYANYIDQK